MELSDTSATEAAGQKLAAAIRECRPARLCLWLKGELGAGKTTLSRGLIQALGHTGRVPSPTYTLVEPYSVADYNVYHLDLYRLGDAQELDFLGVDEYWDSRSLLVVEWPERGGSLLPDADILIELSVAGAGREFTVQTHSTLGEQIATVWRIP